MIFDVFLLKIMDFHDLFAIFSIFPLPKQFFILVSLKYIYLCT